MSQDIKIKSIMKGTKLSLGFSYVRRAPYQALAVVSVMAVSFFIISLLGVLMYGSEQVLKYFESQPQIIAFLKEDAKGGDVDALEQKLRSDGRVKELKRVSKEEAFELYKSDTSDNPLLAQFVSPTSFPASLEFSTYELTAANELIKELQSSDVVDNVGFTASVGSQNEPESVIGRIRNVTTGIRVTGIVSALVLTVTSFIVLLVIMSLRVSMRRSEIESMNLIGASSWFIRAPVLVEAIVYSTLGAFLGWLSASVVLLYSSPRIFTFTNPINVIPREPQTLLTLLAILLGIQLISSVVIAVVGAWIAVSRHIRFQR